jgi:hypothetical protein
LLRYDVFCDLKLAKLRGARREERGVGSRGRKDEN